MRSHFDAIVALAADERARRVADLSAGDPELGAEVARLLAGDEAASARLGPLDRALAVVPAAATSTSPDASPLGDPLRLMGRFIAHFEVLAPLGVGGMGAVYRARDVRLGRIVALKLPLPGLMLDASGRARFLREARAAAALDHPNVCQVLEAGETEDGQLYLAMPEYAGETLRARLERGGAMPLDDALGVARQVLRGLEAAHAAGMVHRDLKPGNVMLMPDGAVRLLDFGLATGLGSAVTGTGERLGTVAYMAPEQVRGAPADARADLWAFGVLLHEMLFGRRPFDRGGDVATAYAVLHDEPALPPDATVPRGIGSLVLWLLEKAPADRPESAAAVLAVLTDDRMASGSTGRGWRRLLRGWWRRRPAARRVVPATVVVTAIATGFYARGALTGTTPAPELERSLAVLPFVEEGAPGADAPIGEGLRNEVLDELAGMRDLVVASRTSTASYAGSGAPTRRIAQELGVATVMEGIVRHADGRVDVRVRLVDAASDREILVRRYARQAGSMMTLPRDITRDVARALRVQVSAADRRRLEQPVTSNVEAYDLYLQGRDYESRGTTQAHLDATRALYRQALALDPGYAAAQARLIALDAVFAGGGGLDTVLQRLTREAQALVTASPQLADAHRALGRVWERRGDDERALASYMRALAVKPSSGELHLLAGRVHLRAFRLDTAATLFARAMRLEPRNVSTARELAIVYSRQRRYADALRTWDFLRSMEPDNALAQLIQGFLHIRMMGSPDTMLAVVRRLPPEADAEGMVTYAAVVAHRTARRPAAALAVLDSSDAEVSSDGFNFRPTALLRASVLTDLGQHSAARRWYARAARMLEDTAVARPEDPRVQASLGLAYAGLGRRAEAEAAARRTIALSPRRNAFSRPAYMMLAAEVFGQTGNAGEATVLLDTLLRMPAGREVSVPLLRVDPVWDPIREDPRFQALLTRGDPAPPAAAVSPPASPASR